MIYDGDLKPLGESEYRERLLAQTMMLVLAAGGELVLRPEVMHLMGTHHVLHQDTLPDGSIRLRVFDKTKVESSVQGVHDDQLQANRVGPTV